MSQSCPVIVEHNRCDLKSKTTPSIQNESPSSNNESKIFKLSQKCFDHIFEWLSLKCLDNLGQTSTKMQIIVGDYFQRNLFAIQCEIKENGMLLNCHRRCYELNIFNKLIKSILFRQNRWENDQQKFRYVTTNCKSIRKIVCEYSKLGEASLELMLPILKEVETIKINRCTITDKFRGGFLEACPNLKRLSIINANWKYENIWLNHKYPNLIHLDWKDTLQYNELKRFFELNSHVKSFRCNLYNFWANRYQFFVADIKLNDLTIDLNQRLTKTVTTLLNEFYDFGIYKRLHIYVETIDQDFVDAISSLYALESLAFNYINETIDLSQLTQLKELENDYFIGRHMLNINEVANSLQNLERINFNSATTDEFFPFIFHSSKLKLIRIYEVSNKDDFDCIFDLSAMNKERMKLIKACKVTIYIDEEVYLATKWVTNKTKCSLIEIKRADSYDWDDRVIHENESEQDLTQKHQNKVEPQIKVHSPIFKLDIDCFGEIFDYLSFKDLNSIAQTCKPLNLVAGDYFYRNFSSVELDDRMCKRMKLFNFDQYIQRVRFFSGKLEPFRYIAVNCHKSIRCIHFDGIKLVYDQIEFLKQILSKVEMISFKNCKISQRFYEEFPNMCPDLKRLNVENTHICPRATKRTGNEWLLQKFAKIEHLGWIQYEDDSKISELKSFFKQNPNLRSFSINYHCLWASRELIIESNVKLIELFVEIDVRFCQNIEQIFDLLDELYTKGHYKRLNLKLNYYKQHIKRMSSLCALTGLRINRLSHDIILSSLANLRELTLNESFYYENGKLIKMTSADIIALVNLERVYLKKTLLEDILLFAYHSVKLKKMKIDFICTKTGVKGILNLPTMNKERGKLFESRKLTIYVEEKVYLATKWMHYNTDLSLIEMRRKESFE